MIMIIKKNSTFIISRNTCKNLAEHQLRTSDLTLRTLSTFYHIFATSSPSRELYNKENLLCKSDGRGSNASRKGYYDNICSFCSLRFRCQKGNGTRRGIPVTNTRYHDVVPSPVKVCPVIFAGRSKYSTLGLLIKGTAAGKWKS